MPRILYLAKGGNVDGGQRQLLHLMARLDRLFEAKVVCTAPGAMVDQLSELGVPVEVRDHTYAARVQRLADAGGLDGRLVLTGRQDDMPAVLNSLDLLVSLSGGSVMYEAMSCGLCVISAGFTKAQDAMHLLDGVTAVVLPTREPSAVAATMKRLLLDPTRRHELGTKARKRAEAKFAIPRMVAQTMEYYDHLLANR